MHLNQDRRLRHKTVSTTRDFHRNSTMSLIQSMNSWLCEFPQKRSLSISCICRRELHLQIKLIELQTLLAQAQHEPRLKGPFPVDLYRNILTSLQSILDRLHSMRCVTTREEW